MGTFPLAGQSLLRHKNHASTDLYDHVMGRMDSGWYLLIEIYLKMLKMPPITNLKWAKLPQINLINLHRLYIHFNYNQNKIFCLWHRFPYHMKLYPKFLKKKTTDFFAGLLCMLAKKIDLHVNSNAQHLKLHSLNWC